MSSFIPSEWVCLYSRHHQAGIQYSNDAAHVSSKFHNLQMIETLNGRRRSTLSGGTITAPHRRGWRELPSRKKTEHWTLPVSSITCPEHRWVDFQQPFKPFFALYDIILSKAERQVVKTKKKMNGCRTGVSNPCEPRGRYSNHHRILSMSRSLDQIITGGGGGGGVLLFSVFQFMREQRGAVFPKPIF